MSFNREDFYDECKSYVMAVDMLEYLDDYWKYDMPQSIIDAISSKCHHTIEFYEKKYHNRVLRND